MTSGGAAAPRARHLLRIAFVLVSLFTAGLVTAGVVAGAGPLAVLSDSTPTESTTDPGATSTESTTDSETTAGSTTTETESTTESTTTESTTTESTPAPSGPPTITSDKADYSPSELVTLSGTNWRPGEVVNIDVNDDQGQSWRRSVSVVANASGEVVDQFNLPDWFVATYRVVASGATSGVVTTSFTDGNVRVETNAGGPTVTLTYTQFAGTGCSGSILAGPTTATISPTSADTILFGQSTGSFRLAVPSSAGTQTFSQWTSQSNFSSSDNPLCFDAISGNRTFTANYVASPTFNVTFDKTGIGGDTGSNVVLTVGSNTYTAAQLPVTLSFASGTSVTYAYSSPVSASAGKRYTLSGVTGPPSPFTVSANTAVTGTYGTQFQLSLATNPAAVGTGNITGASTGDWFNSGAVVSLGATTPVPFNGGNSRYVFTSWSGGASGSSNPVSVTMSAPRSVTANYGTEHKLTLATNPVAVGAGNLTGGTNGSFYAEGTVLSLAATTPVSFNSGGSRYVFASWSGDASGSSNPVSVTMGAPRSVTANYGTEHKLTLSTNPGAVGIANLTGGTSGNFYAEGIILSLGATTPVAINVGSQYRFDHWSGGASGAATPVSVTMTGPKDVTAHYVTQYKLTLATNPSGVGVGNISGGTNGAFYDAGSSLTLQATTPVSIDASSRYRFDHWSGDASGATNPVSVTVSGPTSVTAHYVTQYKLTLTTNPSGVGVGNISGGTNGAFYDAGSSLTLQATTPVSIDASSRYRFDHWSGDASGSPNPASVTMNAPKAVTADYVVQYLLTLSTSPEAGIGGAANRPRAPRARAASTTRERS